MDQFEHPLTLLIRKLATHRPLGEAERRAILGIPYKRRKVEAQTQLVREGDRPDRCAVLVTGYAYRHKVTGDGARQILSVHIPGEAVDFQNVLLEEADHNVQMLTRGEIVEIGRQTIEDLMTEWPNIAGAVMVTTLVEASIFREWVLNVGRRDSRKRIAHLLCEFACRLDLQGLGNGGSYELPMTQEQLADATGMTSVHVNRTLKVLEADGLIVRDRRVVRFPDWERMRDVADFNTRYLHALERAH